MLVQTKKKLSFLTFCNFRLYKKIHVIESQVRKQQRIGEKDLFLTLDHLRLNPH